MRRKLKKEIVMTLLILMSSLVWGATTTLVSIASNGTQGDSYSDDASVSADGRYVAFSSKATNLVSGDTNGASDIFVRDTKMHTTVRVSVSSGGIQGNDHSYTPSISGDGRYIAFSSSATNLVSNDTNARNDIFVHDMQSGTTSRVSIATNGTEGNDHSSDPSISADGRYVAFSSFANSLVIFDTSDQDIFVHDRQSGTTTRVSVDSAGQQPELGYNCSSPAISADGRYVVFRTDAANLVPGDDNGKADVFLRDLINETTTRVSIATDGSQVNDHCYNPAISADGRYVAFETDATNLVSGDVYGIGDIFVRDRLSGTTVKVSVASDGTPGNDSSYYPAFSADGRYIVFKSAATNLIDNDTNSYTDIFMHDQQNGMTVRVSIAANGVQADSFSNKPVISSNGRYVAFYSYASNLVAGDINGQADVFVRDTLVTMPPIIMYLLN